MRKTVYEMELERLMDLFNGIDSQKLELADGLIKDAAFLKAENASLKEKLMEIGTVQFHPQNASLQRTTEAGKQYLKNVNSYATVIKTLNSLLGTNIDDDSDLEDYE